MDTMCVSPENTSWSRYYKEPCDTSIELPILATRGSQLRVILWVESVTEDPIRRDTGGSNLLGCTLYAKVYRFRTDATCVLGKISKLGEKVCTQGDSDQYPAYTICEGVPIQVYAATTDNNLHAYHLKGRRDFSIKMPSLVVQLEAMETRCALADGNVRLYDAEKNLLHTLKTQEPIAALRFGPYAREDGALAVVSVTGKLTIFMLNRKADLRKPKTLGAATAGYPPEQDIPLKVPKKTKLYVEQTQRAKLQAGEIHRAFQKDLCLLRLTAARAYVKTITDGRQGVSAVGAAASLRLHAQCQGLVRWD
ncbi:unnamed protein product [Ectocarpus sp. CCAP 1310/34]|nr:unnamed protein product [Ectocarpus sp. CCAP 1310/34]